MSTTHNPVKKKEYNRRYTATHKSSSASREYWRAYYQKNKERYKTKYKYERPPSYAKKYYALNKEKLRFYSLSRFHKKRSSGSHTLDQWDQLKTSYQHCCLRCGRQESFCDLDYLWLTEDHVIPVSKGGSNYIDNIQPLCLQCNRRKLTDSTDYRFPQERQPS